MYEANLEGMRNMAKLTTTKATHRGITIAVLSENAGHGTTYSCTNTSGKPKASAQWFATQGEAIANERREIDSALGLEPISRSPLYSPPRSR